MSRVLTALLATGVLGTLGAIGWHARLIIPEASLMPGWGAVIALFSAGLALPYAVCLGLVALGDLRSGLRVALGTGIVNALWSLVTWTAVSLGGRTGGRHSQTR